MADVTARYIVARVGEIPVGGRKLLDIQGRSIGVFNVGGEYFAVRNKCPHQGGELCRGYLTGLLRAEKPGKYDYSRRGEILRCPWHGWEFDIRTGQSWFDPVKTRVRSYEARVESGATLAACPGVASVGVGFGYRKGPYIAETYEVSIEQDYVVVTL